jgi:hypothetical protein
MTVHVANLYRKHFEQLLALGKFVEVRERRRRDRLIESLERGTIIVFREARSSRALSVRCAGKPRRRGRAPIVYRIPLSVASVREIQLAPAPKVQGWVLRSWTYDTRRYKFVLSPPRGPARPFPNES